MNNEKDSLFLYAAKNYTNTTCHNISEFKDDLKIIVHIKKIFTRYYERDEVNLRLALNHIISFYNVFESSAATRLLFHHIPDKQHSILKSFLTYLDRCPEYVIVFWPEKTSINISEIQLDEFLLSRLMKEIG